MANELNRDVLGRVNRPLVWVAAALVGFGFGFVASFDANRDSLPYHRGEVVRIALFWGLVIATVLVLAVLVGVVVGRTANRLRMQRLFPSGSVTEVVLAQDALVVTRPAGTRTIPYSRIRRVQVHEHTQWIVVRGRPTVEILPAGLLPPDAIETVQARASGADPLSWSREPGGSERRIVVPDGWAAQVATANVREILHGSRFRVRAGLFVLASAPIAYVAGAGWLGLGPVLALAALGSTYVRTRRAMAAALPSGSTTGVEVLDDRMISRTARWAREIRFDDVREVKVRGGVVFLRMRSSPPLLALARDLVPDDVLERLRAPASAS